jgi:hypothetical protein
VEGLFLGRAALGSSSGWVEQRCIKRPRLKTGFSR